MGEGGGNLKTIVCQTCLHSDTKTYPFGQLPSQSYKGIQSGWEISTVVQKMRAGASLRPKIHTVAQKMLLEKGGGTQNTNRPSEMRPKMHTVVQKRNSPSQLASQASHAFSDERPMFCVAFPLNGLRFGLPRAFATQASHAFSDERSAFCVAFPLNGSRFGVPRACQTTFCDHSAEMRRKTVTVEQKRSSYTHKHSSELVHESQTQRVRNLERRS